MAPTGEPKRPASAYFLYVNATRDKVSAELGSKKFGDVTKVQAERWKSLSADEKSKYEAEAAQLKVQYEKDVAAFEEAGGVMGQKRAEKKEAKAAKEDKKAKKEANKDAPKRPAGGAFGVWLNKHRAEIFKTLPAGSKCTAVAPVASSRWKAMSEAEKEPYEKEYKDLKAKYDLEVKAWKDAKGDADEAGASPEKGNPKASPKKRKADGPSPAPANKSKGRGKGAKMESQEGAVAPEILEKASSLKLESALKNLASRKEMQHIGADKMLDALQNSGGLVNKAKAALLGA